nr:hypothetical protein [Acidobacteriota bacterium]
GAPLAPATAAAAPVLLSSFPGIPATGERPPDCTLAAGPSHVLVAVNASLAIYNKVSGQPLKRATLAAWFQNVISGAFIFDPRVLYDQHAGRWVVLAVARGPGARESWFLLSVSKTGDPLGGWWNYKINAKKSGALSIDYWADYPCLGVDNQALYLTADMLTFLDTAFVYSMLRIIPKAGLYQGGPLKLLDFIAMRNADGELAFTLQPCHTYGAPGVQYFVNSFWRIYPFPPADSDNRLSRWALTDPTTSPRLTRITIPTARFRLPPDAAQKGGGLRLDTGDMRLLNAVYRGGSIWCALTTAHNWGFGNRAACHWFQINATNGFITQQGIFGWPTRDYFYPAVMPDSNGNMVMVFCRSSSAEYGSIGYTGRRASDPPGRLQDSAVLQAGVANYQFPDGNFRNRWGDYNGIGADPADSLRVWFYSMYALAEQRWATHVGSSKF